MRNFLSRKKRRKIPLWPIFTFLLSWRLLYSTGSTRIIFETKRLFWIPKSTILVMGAQLFYCCFFAGILPVYLHVAGLISHSLVVVLYDVTPGGHPDSSQNPGPEVMHDLQFKPRCPAISLWHISHSWVLLLYSVPWLWGIYFTGHPDGSHFPTPLVVHAWQ